jgi:hypothetical protein
MVAANINGKLTMAHTTEIPQVSIQEMRAYTAPGFPPCTEFYVYLGPKLIRVCPSRGMAEDVAAGVQ